MALAIDASTPALAGASNDPWVSPSFTPPVDSLLVIVAMGDWFGGTPTITPTSSGLTFVSQKKQGATNQGVCQIFTAEVGSNGGTARTVSVTTSISSDVGGVKVYVVTGQHPTLYVDTVGGGTSTTNNLTAAALTTGFDGCWVLGGGAEWESLGVPTSTDVREGFDDADLSLMCVRKAAATSPAGAVTLNFDAGGSGTARWTWAAISIRPDAAAGATGTAAVTQASDTSTASGSVTGSVTGTASVTQASDTATAVGKLGDSDMAQAAGYSFNTDTVSGSKVRDLAGYFLDGTVSGSTSFATGQYGNGLNCTGGAMTVGPIDEFSYPANTDGGLSIAAWVKLNTTTAAARCIASATASAALKWALYASNATGNVEAKIAGVTFSTSTSIRDGAFHHVMVVLDATPATDTVKIYVDGTQVLSTTTATPLTYNGNVTMKAGLNAFAGGESLDGIVDDLRWWNDPIESASVSTVMGAEQVDFQLAAYPFDDDTVEDFSIYNRDLTKTANGSYVTGLYGRALQSNSTGAGATATVSFGDVDRLSITGWMRLDSAPGSSVPILAINTSGGASKLRAVVNTDRTVTATWVTVYGTYAVTSSSVLTVGAWSRFQIAMNPTYVNIRLDSTSQTITNTSQATPVISPTVTSLDVLYVGGDQSAGGAVTFDYLTFTKNFVNAPTDQYWTGPQTLAALKPANIARGVYEFNENTGTSVDDRSSSNNDLTLTAGGSWMTGVQGSALHSAGTSPNGAGARKASGLAWGATPKGWAFSGWFKCRAASSGARILVMRNSGGEVAHAFYLSGAFQLRLYGSGGTTGILNPNGGTVASETWTHLAASCNGNSIQFFLNGLWYGSAAYTQGTLLAPTELNVGGDTSDDAVADVDSLTLFDTPLSSANVAWLYANPGDFVSIVTGTAGVSQASQTASAAGKLGYTGTTAATQAGNTASSIGKLGYTGTAARTQAAQTSTASGSIAGAVSGTVAATQAAQTSAASGKLGYTGATAAAQAAQSSNATGQLGYTGSSVPTQANQTGSASGLFTAGGSFAGTVAVTQAGNTSSAAGAVVNPFLGVAAPVQADQSATATGILRYTGTLAVSQASNTAVIQGVVFIPATGALAETQADQTAHASGSTLGAVVIRPNTGRTLRPFTTTTPRP